MSLLVLNEIEIQMRADGMINATQICHAGNKSWKDFKKLKQTEAFIKEISISHYGVGGDSPIPNNNSIMVEITNGPNELRATWVCKELAVKLAAWICPAFEVQTMRWAWSMATGEIEKIIPEIVETHDKINNTESEVFINSVDIELKRKELDIKSKEVDARFKEADNRSKELDNESFKINMQIIELWRSMGTSERDEIKIKDFLGNKLLSLGQSLSSNVEVKEVTVSGRALELGRRLSHGQLIRVGTILARLYRSKYGQDVKFVKRTQWVDGAPREVNVYNEDDIDLIDKAIMKL